MVPSEHPLAVRHKPLELNEGILSVSCIEPAAGEIVAGHQRIAVVRAQDLDP